MPEARGRPHPVKTAFIVLARLAPPELGLSHHHQVEKQPLRWLPIPRHPPSLQGQGLIEALISILNPAPTPKEGPTSEARSLARRPSLALGLSMLMEVLSYTS